MKPTKILIQREHLAYTLDRVTLFTQSKPVIPAYGMIHFSHDNGILNLTAFDGETQAVVSCPWESKGDEPFIPFSVDAVKIHSIVRLSVEETVEITFKQKGTGLNTKSIVTFKMGKARHEFHCITEPFPQPRLGDHKFTFEMKGSDMIGINETVFGLIKKDEIKIMGMGVGMEYIQSESTLYAWGGDGQMIGGYKIPMNPVTAFENFIIPYKVVKHAHAVFKAGETITISMNGGILTMHSSDITINTTVPQSKYLPCYSLFSKQTGHTMIATVHTGEILMATKRINVHADDTNFTIRLRFNEKNLDMFMEHTMFNQEGEESINYMAADAVMPMDISTNINFLKPALEHCSSDLITMSAVSHTRPLLIASSKGDRQLIFMVMATQQAVNVDNANVKEKASV